MTMNSTKTAAVETAAHCVDVSFNQLGRHAKRRHHLFRQPIAAAKVLIHAHVGHGAEMHRPRSYFTA